MSAAATVLGRRKGDDTCLGEGLGRLHVVHPGQVAVGRRGDRLETLLGSCVSVILTDPRRTVGAMCHIVHVGVRGGSGQLNAAHGSVALQQMTERLLTQGVVAEFCDAFVYGGGNMFPSQYGGFHVGASNARWVLGALANRRIRIVHRDLGGTVYRRVRWAVGLDMPSVTSTSVEPGQAGARYPSGGLECTQGQQSVCQGRY